MPDATAGIIGGSALLGGSMQASASKEAAEITARSQAESLAEQRRQFDIATEQLKPFVGDPTSIGLQQAAATPFQLAGTEAAKDFLDLLGVTRGFGDSSQAVETRQREAIQRLEQSPQFQEQIRAGEEALLQRASATGGLRGGNVQAALAQFRPALLSQEIDRRLAQLGGLAGTTSEQALQSLQLGGAAAARQAASALQFGQNIGQTYSNLGSAQAQRALSGGMGTAGQFVSSIPSLVGTYQGLTGRNLFASTPSAGTMMASGGVMV